MKRILLTLLVILAIAGMTIMGCKSDQATAPQGKAKINGTISDATTGAALSAVTLMAQTLNSTQSYITDNSGGYTFTFTVDSTATVTLSVTKSGYRDTVITVPLESGLVVSLSIALNPRSVITSGGVGTTGGSGLAHTIAFLGTDNREIRVYGVGGQERAILGWEARDSLGLAIDAAHAVDISFSMVNGPGGGEYISPTTVRTNAIGQAFITVNSGIKAGVMMIVAQATVGGATIISSPVRVIIDAGFAVQSHFSLAAVRYNFPALHWQGKRDGFSVLLGDIYSNPVAENTAVYFHTSPYPANEIGGAGVIQPSVFTDINGQGSVSLISGNPPPMGTYAAPAGNGYHYVVARTLGQGGTIVADSVLILWSGYSTMTTINPDTFNIPNTGSRRFTFSVTDELGHPLCGGTLISVTALVPPPPTPLSQVNQVQLAFGQAGSVTLLDNIYPGLGSTDFSFLLSDGTWGITDGTVVTVTVAVTSENGNIYQTISGVVY